MAKRVKFNLKVNADGFCWKVISVTEAKKRYKDNKEVYVLSDDDTEFLVEDDHVFSNRDVYGIELGFMSKSSIESIKEYLKIG